MSALLDRWRWLVYVGAGILVYVAIEMIFEDRLVHGFVGESLQSLETMIALVGAALFLAFAWLWSHRATKSATS